MSSYQKSGTLTQIQNTIGLLPPPILEKTQYHPMILAAARSAFLYGEDFILNIIFGELPSRISPSELNMLFGALNIHVSVSEQEEASVQI